MKSFLFLLIGLIIGAAVSYYFCGHANRHSEIASLDAAAHGLANCLMDSSDIKRMTTAFSDSYCQKDKEMTRSVWFDRSTFLFMGNYLAQNKNVDGIRIFFIKYQDHYPMSDQSRPGRVLPIPGQNSEQSGKFRQTSVVFVPTHNINGSSI